MGCAMQPVRSCLQLRESSRARSGRRQATGPHCEWTLHHYGSFVRNVGCRHTFLSAGNPERAYTSDGAENIMLEDCLHIGLVTIVCPVPQQAPKINPFATCFKHLLLVLSFDFAYAGSYGCGASLESERVERLSGLGISHVAWRSSELKSERVGSVVGGVEVEVEVEVERTVPLLVAVKSAVAQGFAGQEI